MTTKISNGAQNKSSYDLLRQFLNPTLKGKNWEALLKGLAEGDSTVRTQIQNAFNQLFLSTASGIYLKRLAADNGIIYNSEVGLSDEDFQKLCIAISSNKITYNAIEEVLEIFYGQDSVKSTIISTVQEPYDLSNNDTLLIKVDNNEILTITFTSSDFRNINYATAEEIALVITRYFKNASINAEAFAYTLPSNNSKYVKITSALSGLKSSISIYGGSLQNTLLFPTKINTTHDGTTRWTITQPTIGGCLPGRIRFTWSNGTDPSLYLLQEGDYVNIYGSSFNSLNRGTHNIVNVYASSTVGSAYFDIELYPGFAEVVIPTITDIQFYAPTRNTIQNSTVRPAFVSSTNNGLDVVMPVTSTVINRDSTTAAYLHSNSNISISSASRDATGTTTLTFSSPHGLLADQWIFVDGLSSNYTLNAWQWTVRSGPIGGGTGWKSSGMVELNDNNIFICGGDLGGSTDKTFSYNPTLDSWNILSTMTIANYNHKIILLDNNRILSTGGNSGGSLDYCEIYDPNVDVWMPTATMTNPREGHFISKLANGNVFVCGGTTAGGGGLGAPEIYDVTTGTWSLATACGGIYDECCGAVFPDGRILMATGDSSTGADRSEVYNPITDTWVQTANAIVGGHRARASAILLPNLGTSGTVMVTGGDAAGSVNSVDFLDIATLTWRAGPTMPVACTGHVSLLTADNEIMVIGGDAGVNTQIYNPLYNTWRLGPNLNVATVSGLNSCAILMNNNRILLWDSSTIEIYNRPSWNHTTQIANSGGLNGLFKIISTPTPLTLTYSTPNYPYYAEATGGTITSISAPDSQFNSPYLFSHNEGVALTDINTTLTTEIIVNRNYKILNVTSTTDFPKTGYIVLGLGTDQQTFIEYVDIISGTEILLNSKFVAPYDLSIGTNVIYCNSNQPYDPNGLYGGFYVTSSNSGRLEAIKVIDSIKPSGIDINYNTIYPSDRGLGNEGAPVSGTPKLSDNVVIFGSNDLDSELETLRTEA